MSTQELENQVEAMRRKRGELHPDKIVREPKNEFTEPKTVVSIETCPGCGNKFESKALKIGGKELCKMRHCEACVLAYEQQEDARQAQDRQQELDEKWEAFMSEAPLYAQQFDTARCVQGSVSLWREKIKERTGDRPTSDQETLERAAITQRLNDVILKVSNWKKGDKGLGLIGESGFGKTRILFAFLLKRMIQSGVRCEYITATGFAHECGSQFGTSAAEAKQWINRLIKAPIFFLDDLGKEPLTERVEAELFHVIESRTALLLPVFFTANATGKELKKKMSDDRGRPLIRRLRQFCESITL